MVKLPFIGSTWLKICKMFAFKKYQKWSHWNNVKNISLKMKEREKFPYFKTNAHEYFCKMNVPELTGHSSRFTNEGFSSNHNHTTWRRHTKGNRMMGKAKETKPRWPWNPKRLKVECGAQERPYTWGMGGSEVKWVNYPEGLATLGQERAACRADVLCGPREVDCKARHTKPAHELEDHCHQSG